MSIILVLIPIVFAFILIAFFSKKMCLWEYVLLFVVSIGLSYAIYGLCYSSNTDDIKYVSTYVEKATYYEPWNERVRHTRRVKTGKNTYITQVYYTTRYHSAKYEIILNNKESIYISEKQFNNVIKTLNTNKVFRDMYRHYYTKDGDAYDYNFDNKIEHLYEYAISFHYKNKIKSSTSIFKYSNISNTEAEQLGLYDYPDIKGGEQNIILGSLPINNSAYLYKLNAINGIKNDFKLFVLTYKDKDPSIIEYQKSYWQGGNQNEVVLCIGYDSNNRITWCDAFSWANEPNIEVACKMYFLTHSTFDAKEFYSYINPKINTEWQARDFNDFEYLSVDLSVSQWILIIVITILIDLGLTYWLVTNEYVVKE